jgi:hypothetical protein
MNLRYRVEALDRAIDTLTSARGSIWMLPFTILPTGAGSSSQRAIKRSALRRCAECGRSRQPRRAQRDRDCDGAEPDCE